MTEYIFRASDPDTAMEKAVRELGDDAMILSVRKMGDVTEVRATRESDMADQLPWDDRKPQSWPSDAMDLGAAMRTARARRNGSDPAPTPRRAADINAAPLREKGTDIGVTAAPVARPAEEPETILDATQFEELFRQRLAETPDDKPELVSNAAEPVSRQQDPIARETATARDSSAGQTVPFAPDKADSTDNWVEDSALAAQVPAAKQPSATILNEAAVAQHRVSIFDFGFPKDIAQSCAVAPDLHTLQAQQDHACHLLAARITDDAEISVVHENKALFLFGPPGAGKTTVAAQLAFERLRSTAFQPRLVQVPQKGFVSCGRLQQYATLLNSEFRTLSFEDDEDIARNDIIDCDLTEPDAIAEALEWVTERSSGSDISPLLIIPSTWSIAAIKQYTMMFEAICPATVLTHMDIGGIDIAGLSAMADANIKLIAANETRKITEGLTLVDRDSVERFLQVTLATSVEDAQQYSTRHQTSRAASRFYKELIMPTESYSMSMLSPAAVYKRQQQNPGFNPEDSHQLIKATLEYLVRSLGILMQEPARDSEIFQTHIARVLTSIYVLQSSLDFERGGDISVNLFQLYEYSRQQTLKLMRNDDTAQIDRAYYSISEIFDAWQKIK